MFLILGRGYQIKSEGRIVYEYDNHKFSAGNLCWEFFFCLSRTLIISPSVYIIRNESLDAPMYHRYCWNDSKTFNNHSYRSSTNYCESESCISKYRVKDGYDDCFGSDDEDEDAEIECDSVRKFRFKCQATATCLMISNLRFFTDRDKCQNLYLNNLLSTSLLCLERRDPGCAIIRESVVNSSQVNNQTNLVDFATASLSRGDSLTIPFRFYCDSFFDRLLGADESVSFCTTWICSKDQFQCSSGQCISPGWLCDGKFRNPI